MFEAFCDENVTIVVLFTDINQANMERIRRTLKHHKVVAYNYYKYKRLMKILSNDRVTNKKFPKELRRSLQSFLGIHSFDDITDDIFRVIKDDVSDED